MNENDFRSSFYFNGMNSPQKITLILFLIFGASLNGFANWRKINSNTLSWFQAVFFINERKGWIAGTNGTFLITEDGGNAWKQTEKFTDDTIKDIYFLDENRGWLLTDKGKFFGGKISPSAILETSDGGKTWHKVALEGGGSERLTKIFFSKEGMGRAIGEAGAVFEMRENSSVWKKSNVSLRYLLLGGNFADAKKATIVGGGGSSFLTEDGGNSWKPAAFTRKPEVKLNSVFFINKSIGWIVGLEGKIFSTNNGGKMWREQDSKVSQNLFDVFFQNTAEGWAVGDEGLILHTTTAGNLWEVSPSKTSHRLERVFAIGNKVWAVGFGGTILCYEKN